MKYLALFLVATIINYSCNSTGQTIKMGSQDTVLIVANQVGNWKFLDSAIQMGVKGFIVPTDSTSTGKWGPMYRYRLGQRTDTLRDSTGKPRLDAAKNPIVHFIYPPTPVDDSLSKYIEV